jgi:MIP family channel proteins
MSATAPPRRPIHPEVPAVNAYVAELVGTFLLVVFIALYLSVSQKLLGPGTGGFDLASLALLHFLVLAVLVYTLGGTSGANFNPAVTITLLVLKKMTPKNAGAYIVAQVIGGTLGALVCRIVLADEGKGVKYGAALVNHGATTTAGAFVCEALGTFVLMLAIMGTAVNPRGEKALAGLVIGGALGFAVMVFGPLTGGSLNPARWFGPALVSGDFSDGWLYIVAPILGALAAGYGYRAIEIDAKDRIGERPIDALD